MSEPKKPKPFDEPSLETKKIRERIHTGHLSVFDALSAQITILKKYFGTQGLPAEAAQELDEFMMDVQDRWTVAAETIRGEHLSIGYAVTSPNIDI